MSARESIQPDPGPDPRLKAALSALPETREPPADLWPQLRRALPTAVDEQATKRRRERAPRGWIALTGIAAALALAIGALSVRSIRLESPDDLEGLSAGDRQNPRVIALIEQTRAWREAVRDPVRSARWPKAAQSAVDEAIGLTDRALVAARAAVTQDPNDRDARAAVDALLEQRQSLLRHAMSLLDEL